MMIDLTIHLKSSKVIVSHLPDGSQKLIFEGIFEEKYSGSVGFYILAPQDRFFVFDDDEGLCGHAQVKVSKEVFESIKSSAFSTKVAAGEFFISLMVNAEVGVDFDLDYGGEVGFKKVGNFPITVYELACVVE